MKNKDQKRSINFSIIALFALLPFFLSACSDDDDNGNGINNHFTYDGDTYSLHEGMKMYWGSGWGNGYNWDIYLYSEGIEFDETEMDFTGSGHGIFLEIFSPIEEGVEDGTYTFDTNDEENSFSFGTWSSIIIDYDGEEDSGTELDIIGGTVEISKSGNTYDISFDMTVEDDKTVTGNFSGPLPAIDFGWLKDGEASKITMRK